MHNTSLHPICFGESGSKSSLNEAQRYFIFEQVKTPEVSNVNSMLRISSVLSFVGDCKVWSVVKTCIKTTSMYVTSCQTSESHHSAKRYRDSVGGPNMHCKHMTTTIPFECKRYFSHYFFFFFFFFVKAFFTSENTSCFLVVDFFCIDWKKKKKKTPLDQSVLHCRGQWYV